MACGLPMLTAEGECRTGASIGPICSSIARVSRNSSASGISFQARRGAPMSTVETSGRSPFQQLTSPALVSKVSARSHAVAAGAGLRAIVVVDADIAVGTGDARGVQRHELVVVRTLRNRDR